jgi:hypothetical protein
MGNTAYHRGGVIAFVMNTVNMEETDTCMSHVLKIENDTIVNHTVYKLDI